MDNEMEAMRDGSVGPGADPGAPQGETANPSGWARLNLRLSPEDQLRVIGLYQRSGARSKSDFVRAQILREDFRVVVVSQADNEYYRKLSELTAQVQRIGVLYNQAVRSLNSHHSARMAATLTRELAAHQGEIAALVQRAVDLTEEYRRQ